MNDEKNRSRWEKNADIFKATIVNEDYMTAQSVQRGINARNSPGDQLPLATFQFPLLWFHSSLQQVFKNNPYNAYNAYNAYKANRANLTERRQNIGA